MTLRHQLDTLLVYDPNRSSGTVNVWVSHPTPSEAQVLGTLFVISSIGIAGRIGHEVTGLLQDELKTKYYQPGSHRAEPAFETALQHANQRMHALIRDGVANWVDSAQIVVGAMWRDMLLLASLGAVHAFLVRSERLHEILGQPTTAKPNPLRLFDQVISGQVQADDRLLICTPSLLDYFSMDKLRRTLLDHRPSQAARVLESTLLGQSPRLGFGALLVAFEAEAIPALTPPPLSGTNIRPAPQLSMDQLVARERSTERIMAPSVWPTLKEFGSGIRQWAGRTTRTIARRPPKRFIPSQTVPHRPPGPGRFSLWLKRARLSMQALRPAKRSALPKSSVPDQPRVSGTTWPKLRRIDITSIIERIIRWYQHLIPKQRRLVWVFTALVFVLSTAIVRLGNFTQPQLYDQPAETIVQKLETELAQTEAALLFGGDELASQHLGAAEQLLEQLPNRKKADREQRQAFEAEIAKLQTRARRITLVTEPESIIRVASNFPHLQPTQLYVTDTRVIVFDPQDGSAVSAQIDGSGQPSFKKNQLDTGRPRTGTLTSSKRLIFATDRGTFVEFSADDSTWQPLDSRFPVTQPFIQYVAAYQTRIYALDPAHNQIYRFSLATASLGSGQAWLREAADLANARAAVVDGSIFVLQPNGDIEQFFGGRRTDFRLSAIEPPLTNPTRLWTTETDPHLYALDPELHRVVVFDKEGRLIQQYQSDAWTDLRDLVADYQNRRIYVLNGTTVQRFPHAAE